MDHQVLKVNHAQAISHKIHYKENNMKIVRDILNDIMDIN